MNVEYIVCCCWVLHVDNKVRKVVNLKSFMYDEVGLQYCIVLLNELSSHWKACVYMYVILGPYEPIRVQQMDPPA
jgi:hypothetical protein